MPVANPATSVRPAGLSGVCPVLATPFDATGAPDVASLARVVDYALDCGVDAVVFPGVASEVEQLAADEREQLVALVARQVGGRVPLVLGASGADLASSTRYMRQAAQLGAAAVMVMAPARFAGDAAGLLAHYRALADAAPLPIMLQNAPPPAGAGFEMASIAPIVAAVPAVRYVKEEAAPCGQRISALLGRPELRDAAHFGGVLGGAGGRYLQDELARGAIGTMPACELADLHVALMRAWRDGRRLEARTLYNRSLPLLNFQAVFRWSMTKEVLRRRGVIDSAFVRAPGPRLDAQDQQELGTMLDEIADLLTAYPVRAPIATA
ncbi:MAG: dihydrodipicolinate synthase family protein [Betaproteobacteria bacterium]